MESYKVSFFKIMRLSFWCSNFVFFVKCFASLVYSIFFYFWNSLCKLYNFIESVPDNFIIVFWEQARYNFYRRLYLTVVGDIPAAIIRFSIYYATQLVYASFQLFLYVVSSYFRIMLRWLSILYNLVNFSLFFVSAQVFMVLDVVSLLIRVSVYPFVLHVRSLYYKFAMFLLRRRFLILGSFLGYALVFLISLFFMFCIFYLAFLNSDLFGGFVHYDKGMQRLDFITTNLVGSWYSSNWWYFRVWVFYFSVYLFMPSSRMIIRENWYFLAAFPLFLMFYDHRGVSEYFLHGSLDEHWLEAMASFSPFVLWWSNYFRIFPFKYNSSFHSSSSGDVYVSPIDYDPVWSETNFIKDAQITSSRLPVNAVDFGDPDTKDITSRFARRNQVGREHSVEGPGSKTSVNAHSARFLHYNMDYGEMYFRSTEFSDLVSIRAMYFDENYYARVLSDLDSGFLFDHLAYRSYPPYLYGGHDPMSRLYQYRFVGSIANTPKVYDDKG